MGKELDEIRVPSGLTERQVKIAKAWVNFERNIGGTVEEFVESQKPFSTATWYKWRDEFRFNQYIHDLTGSVITEDEREAYQKVKQKIIELATAKDAGIKELELYNQHFSYVVEDEKRKAMLALGIQPKGSDVDTRSLEERKAALFAMRNKHTKGDRK